MTRLQKQLGEFVSVKNMVSDKGNTIANQFIIHFQRGRVFQSYDSIIAVKFNNSEAFLFGEDWDYSRTTSKYRTLFVGMNKKQIEKCMDDNYYKMIDVYNNEITTDNFERLDNCVNGNPRYYIGQFMIEEDIARECGSVKYRGKRYGDGWVFQSYNLQSTCDHLNESIVNSNK